MSENPVDTSTLESGPESFRFRDLHPQILVGTASDRYAGWMGQIYTRARYESRIARRTHTVGGKAFVEETVPVGQMIETRRSEEWRVFVRLPPGKRATPRQNPCCAGINRDTRGVRGEGCPCRRGFRRN